MYNDSLLPLAARLSKPEITRASNVEWSDGKWVATDVRNGEVIAAEPTRQEALNVEHRVIESNLASYA